MVTPCRMATITVPPLVKYCPIYECMCVWVEMLAQIYGVIIQTNMQISII
jgi:hypothetical protein